MPMRRPWCAYALLSCLLCPVSPGQRRVDDRNLGERIILIVPIVGAGTVDDPKRPLFVPTQADREVARASKEPLITSYSVVLSDDRKYALVELVADDRKALEAVLKETRSDVKRFDIQKGKAKKEDIELEFRKYKKDFDFGKFKEGK